MYYKEFLRVRKGFLVYALILGALTLISIAAQGNGHIVVETGAGGTVHGHVAGPDAANIRLPLTLFFAIAGIGSAIFASIVGISLATENDRHLEVVWTLPESRLRYAALVFAVDIVAVLACFALTLFASLAIMYSHGLSRLIVAGSDSWPQLLRFVLYPLAWFGLAQALTASVRGKAGAYSGFAWPAAFILIALLEAPLAPVWHAALQAINYLNPVFYGSYASGAGANSDLLNLSWRVAVTGLACITLAGSLAALVQWRRLEA